MTEGMSMGDVSGPPSTHRPIRRRTVLVGAGVIGGLLGGAALTRRSPESGPVLPAPSRVIPARAGIPLLVDPNRATVTEVVLPPRELGAVVRTVVLPISKGLATPGGGWHRTIIFRQPLSGEPRNPRLAVLGAGSSGWGESGPGSCDVVVLRSTDGVSWSLTEKRPLPVSRTDGRTDLEAVTSLSGCVLAWTAAGKEAGDSTALVAGRRLGPDASGSDNSPIVGPGSMLRKVMLPGSRGVLTPGSGPPVAGCWFTGGASSRWSVVVTGYGQIRPDGNAAQGQPVLSLRSATSGGAAYSPKVFWLPSPPEGTKIGPPFVVAVSSRGTTLSSGLGRSSGFVESSGPTEVPTVPAAGVDVTVAQGLSGLAVYATDLDADDLGLAASRLASVSSGVTV